MEKKKVADSDYCAKVCKKKTEEIKERVEFLVRIIRKDFIELEKINIRICIYKYHINYIFM